jgi:hypothetical protein
VATHAFNSHCCNMSTDLYGRVTLNTKLPWDLVYPGLTVNKPLLMKKEVMNYTQKKII